MRLGTLRLDPHSPPPVPPQLTHPVSRLRHRHRASPLATLPAHRRRKLARTSRPRRTRPRPLPPPSPRRRHLPQLTRMARGRLRRPGLRRNPRHLSPPLSSSLGPRPMVTPRPTPPAHSSHQRHLRNSPLAALLRATLLTPALRVILSFFSSILFHLGRCAHQRRRVLLSKISRLFQEIGCQPVSPN